VSRDASRSTQPSDSRVAEIQRGRTSRRDSILDAVVEVVAERGLAGTSVEFVLARACLLYVFREDERIRCPWRRTLEAFLGPSGNLAAAQ
jgi:hypothetical protein